MKKTTLLFYLLFTLVSFSQELVTNGDFQTGASSPWTGNAANVVDLGGGNFVNQAEVAMAGPNAFAVNLSQVINLVSGNAYQLTYDAYTDSTTGSRTMVVGLGQSGAPFAANTETVTLTDTPTTFTYQTIISYGDAVDDRVLFDMGADAGFVFIDNVSVIEIPNTCSNGVQDGDETGVDCGGPLCNDCPVPPTSAAPTPPARNNADVVSIFTPNGVYTNENPSGIQTFAGASFENFTVDTFEDTRRLTTPTPGGGAQYGFFFGPGTGFNLTDFESLHIDFWLEDAGAAGSVLTVQLQNFDPVSGAFQHNIFTNIDINSAGEGAWISVDLDLSAFDNSGLSRDNIQQIQFIAQGPAFGPTYLTNIYFFKGTVLSADNFSLNDLRVSPNPSNTNWNISGLNTTIDKVEVYDLLGKRVINLNPNTQEVSIDASELKTGIYLAKLTSEGATKTIKLVKN